ncbi:MAG: SCP2 sterol-binding domain-containing protein [Clostridia bacterium]|nr:SCP2 sterol-binding domain-containing protein [Clostridia bacterium]
MNYFEAFDKIKDKLKDVDSDKLGENVALQINLTDDDCHGTFYIQVKDGALYVEPYDYYDNDANITVSFDTLVKIIDKKLDPVEAVAGGMLEVFGNPDKALLLTRLDKKAKKAPAKKPAAKKTATTKKASEKPAEKKPAAKKSAAKKAEEKKEAPKAEKKPAAKKATKKTEK